MWKADWLESSFADLGVPFGKLMNVSQQRNPYAIISCVLDAISKSAAAGPGE